MARREPLGFYAPSAVSCAPKWRFEAGESSRKILGVLCAGLIGRFQRRQRMLKHFAKHPPSPVGNRNQTAGAVISGLALVGAAFVASLYTLCFVTFNSAAISRASL